MPPGHPRIGMRAAEAVRVRKGRITSAAEVLMEAPSAKLLGELDAEALQAMFDKYGEPPWEATARQGVPPGHAPAFVTVPAEWRLRWLNPRLIDQVGFRDWKPVDPTDSRVIVHIKQSIYPDNTIRRGGGTGDLLAWMPRHWYAARMREKQSKADRAMTASVERMEALKEEVNRGGFGFKAHLDTVHPTHTRAEGRTMERDEPTG